MPVPGSHSPLKPDLVAYNDTDKIAVVLDVGVVFDETSNLQEVYRRKTKKYEPLARFLRSQGFQTFCLAHITVSWNVKVFISNNGKKRHECVPSKKPSLKSTSDYIEIACSNQVEGKFITIKKRRGWMILCEVHVFANLTSVNLAYKRPLAQRGTLLSDTSVLSVDGDPQTCGVMRTKPNELPWLRIVLDRSYYITDVRFTFRKSNKDQWFLDRYIHIFVSDNVENFEERLCVTTTEEELMDTRSQEINTTFSLSLTCTKPSSARFVTIQKYKGEYPSILVICEVEIYSQDFPHEKSNVSSSSCREHEYKCLEEECIHQDWLCDGTNDCPLADDEAPSCLKGDKSKFKCKRINKAVNIRERCDGVWNCPDYSDEEHCFEMHGEHLTATYKGEPNFYICSDNWNVKYSASICKEYDRDYTATNYVSFSGANKFLKINTKFQTLIIRDIMSLFYKSYSCNSKKILNIQCDYKQDWTYSCGKRSLPDALLDPHVIKGKDMPIGTWPWYTQIFVGKGFYKKFFCGGSLIHKDWVLTSAHCFDSIRSVNEIYVKFDSNIYDDFDKEQVFVSHVINHPLYNKDTTDNGYDIAMLRLKTPAHISKNMRTICLPNNVFDNRTLTTYQYCVIAGFGDSGARELKLMQQAKMNFLQMGTCTSHVSNFYVHYNLHFYKSFCDAQVPLTTDAKLCKGDGGSPWMCESKDGVWTQVGISRGYKVVNDRICADGILIFNSHYLDFIHRTMKQKFESVYSSEWE